VVSHTTIETVEINGKPKVIRQTNSVGQVKVGLTIDLLLKFIVQNPQGSFIATVGGTTVAAAPGQTSVVVDVGNMLSAPDANGRLSVIDGTVWSGNATADFQLQIIRPLMITAGAFTIPALPLTLIYAPPPGAQNRNFAEYSSMTSVSRKIAGSVSTGTTTKTADAYSTSDFVDKLSGLFDEFGALRKVAAAFPDTPDSTTNSLTTTTEHDLQTTDTDTSTYGTPPGLGPGLGDRFVYLRNVKIAWLIANGELSYTVLGVDGIRAFAAQQLISDANAIASSSGTVIVGPTTNLDADTLQKLLNLDPFAGNPSPTLFEPRFVQNDPATAGGSGTDSVNGDSFSVAHEINVTDITTQITATTTIDDYKPGWLMALVGDSESTENQMNFTSTLAVQNGTDQKQTATVTFFAGSNDPPYLVGLYFDRLFGTFAFTSSGGSELKKFPPVQASETGVFKHPAS
jgi:hypothetical protein